jgi:putative hydrolase of the HAD superfamily
MTDDDRPREIPHGAGPPASDGPGAAGAVETELAAVEAVLLDMGGVILDLGEARGLPWGELDRRGRQALLKLVRETGGEADEATLERLLFAPWRREYARRYARGREAPWEPHVERLHRRTGAAASPEALLEAWAGPYLHGLRTVSGAREALGRLVAADLSLALVSNVPLPGRFFRQALEEQGVSAFFDSLCFSYDEGTRKPSPGLLHRALEALGTEAPRAVLVGDRRSTDVAAGRAAGLRTVWVRSLDEEGPEPEATIGSIVELPELLGLTWARSPGSGSSPTATRSPSTARPPSRSP